MRRFLLFALAATLFVACTKDSINEPAGIILDDNRTLTVSFEGDTEDTRIQLNEEKKSVWTEGDLLSVFYRSTTNEQWQFAGKTGDRSGNILPVDSSVVPTPTTNEIVVVYPYNAGYFYNSDTKNVQASLPAEQSYLKDSYGLDGNIMVSQSEYNQVSLKSVCGWLKLQLTGAGETVKSITLRGNAGEQVAGELYINTADATSTLASELAESGDDGEVGGTLVRPGTILTEVTLNCGEGVVLDAEATAFYIALPPMTFENGFTVDIIATDGSTMTKTTDKALAIERNYIQPMSAFAYTPTTPATPKPANNEIWYTNGSTTEPTAPNDPAAFGSATIQSNTYDAEKECWVIKFDGDVTKIGKDAFEICRNLTNVSIPDSVTTIGGGAFFYCDSLTSVTIPDSVTTIGEGAFSGCTSLTSVTIPDSVTTIGDHAFDSCTSLTSVTIGDSVTTIGEGAFAVCESLISVTIGDSVTTIGNGAFLYCDSLTSVTIPDSVTTIGEMAFYDCYSLTSVNIIDIVAWCNISFSSSNPLCYAGNLYVNGELVTDLIIPDSVTTIGSYAFDSCTSLTSVTIPDSVTTIGERAFSGCNSLTSVTIPDSVTTIGHYVFSGCGSLTSVTIPDSVTTIGNGAFRECASLTSVTIPDSVTSIETGAFYGCSSLTSVTIPDSVTTIGKQAFAGCKSLKEFKGKFAADNGRCLIMDNTIIAYAEASGTTYTIPDSVTTIGSGAFRGCNSLTSVTLGDSITTIEDSAFNQCFSLTSVIIPDSVIEIGEDAFNYCISLTSVNIPDSVTTIGNGAFYVCSSLTSVTIGNSVTTIGKSAFYYCSSLETVYCKPTTPPTGGYDMFYNNAPGRRIFVPASDDDSIINAYKKASYWSSYASYIFEEE